MTLSFVSDRNGTLISSNGRYTIKPTGNVFGTRWQLYDARGTVNRAFSSLVAAEDHANSQENWEAQRRKTSSSSGQVLALKRHG